MTLLGPLTRLASGTTPTRDREQAARELDDALRRWVHSYLRSAFDASPTSLFDDAIQHCLLQASCGTSRFSGSSEGEAHRWCKTVLTNYVRSAHRRSKRDVSLGGPTRDGASALENHDPDAPSPERQAIGRDVQRLMARLVETARTRNGGQLADAVQIWLEYRLTEPTIDEQIRRWARRSAENLDPGDEAAMRKARNRVYTWRKRGREEACAAAKALMRTGTDPEDARLVARLLGCKDGEGPEC